ncbi:MAG TPA: class I SAM-dependent methyltransferase [Dehalococcoidia bacterium]|nr:class I SAM-dependent methyltransferase [Dehalococcoidia bacterium]
MKATGWERIYREQGDLQYDVLPKIEKASRLFKKKGYRNVLDLGCGTGKHSVFLAQEGFEVYATDMSRTGIEIAREKAESLGLYDIHFKQHDMVRIPFTDCFFDAVICIWTIYHGTLDRIQETINEIYRVLNPGGMVLTDFLTVNDDTYGTGKEIEKNTFLGEKKTEEDVPHHYTTREELVHLFSRFGQLQIKASSNSYTDETGKHYTRRYYDVDAVR